MIVSRVLGLVVGRFSSLRVGLGLVVVLGVLLGWVGSAFGAGSAWWHVGSGSRPSVLAAGSGALGVSEVQEVVVPLVEFEGVSAGAVSLRVGQEALGEFATEPVASAFGLTPLSAASVKSALERPYGGGVQVSEVVSATAVTFTVTGIASSEPIVAEGFGLGEPSSVVVTAGKAPVPDGEVVITAENVGESDVDGSVSPVRISDVLPAGVHAVGIGGLHPPAVGINKRDPMTCSLATLACESRGVLAPFGEFEVRIDVQADAGTGEASVVRVTGGGAPDATLERPLRFGGSTPVGVDEYGLVPEEEGGAPATQAGGHPFQLTTTLTLNQGADENSARNTLGPAVEPVALPKDVNLQWPAGLIGNPLNVPACTLGQFLTDISGLSNRCAPNTAVGVAAVTVYEPASFGTLVIPTPVFNLEPANGEPARFGFFVPTAQVPVVIDTSVRTGGDYGVTVEAKDVSQTAAFLSSQVTIWGVPGDVRHDNVRGWGCIFQPRGVEPRPPCTALENETPLPFLSLPTSCTSSLASTIETDPWDDPGVFATLTGTGFSTVNGCERVPFDASLDVKPEAGTAAAASPTGFDVKVAVPQEASQNPKGISESAIKDLAVTLPEGVIINPAAAGGLAACTEAEMGYLPGESDPVAGVLRFTPAPPACPDAAKVGSVKIKTPVLAHGLEGSVFVASQDANPFGAFVSLYVVAEDPVSGTLIKLAGNTQLDPATGRISTSFSNNPQAPVETIEAHFFGGERAPLATPGLCGSYTTSATFTPWSGNEAVHAQSSFSVAAGPDGKPCPAVLPFKPSLAGGVSALKAGGFSPLVTRVFREDGDQEIQSIQVHTPPGFSGLLSKVSLCSEAQANTGTCGPESEIGTTSVSVGVGKDPFTVEGGKVYITGPYQGAPFGLSVTTPAKAGPFDIAQELGPAEKACDCVIVRAKIEVDKQSAQLTVSTDPAGGAHPIPHILAGIPLQVKQVNVNINRPGFSFNPTNCAQLQLTGTITSVQGATAPVGVPFQVANCSTLKFAPKVAFSVSGKTSRVNGTSLTAKVSYPNTGFGTQANIANAKFQLPKQLPSRLTTLHKACLSTVFEKNPAECPKDSVVGHATVTTPVLPVPLKGPAYFVSHGNEAFPALTMVLQGYGITVNLVGSTLIRKGITTTTFKTPPDVPFNTLELTLPAGPFSALGAFGNLCKTKLTLPNTITAQNGLQTTKNTPITTTHCPKPHKHKKPKHNTKKR